MIRSFCICLFALALAATRSTAQDTTRASVAMKKIFIEPFSLIDIFDSPCLRIGAETPLSYSFSAIGTLGLYEHGYYLKGGIKRYGKNRKHNEMYLELSAFYKNERQRIHDNLEYFNSSGAPQYGAICDYNVSREAFGINAEIGWEPQHWGRWELEAYTGVGVRDRTVTTSISYSLQQTLYDFNEGDVARVSDVPARNQVTISLIGGLRFGYCFKKHQHAQKTD